MTLAQQIAACATRIALIAPGETAILMELSTRVRRVELALDEIADDAMESAELAEAGAVFVAFQSDRRH